MPAIYNATLKTTRMQAVLAAIDAGSGPGTIEICTAAYASVLAIFTLTDPAGVVSGDVLVFDMDPDISAAAIATGTAAIARIKDSTGTVVVSGLTVGITGADLTISPSTTITSGQTVVCQTLTLTHAA